MDATGPDRYRRAIYTFVKRTSGYPSFLIFDASDHDMSLARRIPTNTPLQALVTLNDPVYEEAAEALARAHDEGQRTSLDRTPAITERGWFCLAIPTAGADVLCATFMKQALAGSAAGFENK